MNMKMEMIGKVCLSLFMCCCIGTLSAQVMTLSECRKAALEHNASLATSRLKTEKAVHDEKMYKTNFYPNFKLIGGAWYNTFNKEVHLAASDIPLLPQLGQLFPDLATGFTGLDMKLSTGLIYTGGVMLEQPVYMGGKITAAHRMSVLGRQMSEQNEQLTAAEVLVKTDEAYMQAVKAREMKTVAERYHGMLQELCRVVENSYQQGMVPQNDLLRVQVKLNESELALRKADNAIRLSTMNLCHAIGAPLDQAIEVQQEYAEENTAIPVDAGIMNRPEYAILDKQVELAGQQVKLSRSDFLPQVGLMVGYNYLHGLEFNDRSVLDDASFSALLTVSVPLFHFGEGKYKVRSAKAQQAVAEMQRRDLNEQMELELAQAANNWDEAKLEVSIAERSLAQADENVRMTTNQYKAGMATLADCLEAQALWQSAYEAKVEARFEEGLMLSKYRKAAGLLH